MDQGFQSSFNRTILLNKLHGVSFRERSIIWEQRIKKSKNSLHDTKRSYHQTTTVVHAVTITAEIQTRGSPTKGGSACSALRDRYGMDGLGLAVQYGPGKSAPNWDLFCFCRTQAYTVRSSATSGV